MGMWSAFAGRNYVGAVVYPFFLGGFALIDYDRTGFIVMSILELCCLALCLIGIGFVLVPLVHLGSIVWALAVVPRNRRRAEEKKRERADG